MIKIAYIKIIGVLSFFKILCDLLYFVFMFVYSIAMVQFQNQSDAQFVLVGCGCSLQLKPRISNGGCIYTFFVSGNGTKLDLLHRTATDEVCFLIY